MTTRDVNWSKPVNVCFANGVERSFHSIHDTIDFLENEWPKRGGAYHDAAVVTCRSALNHETPPAVAREIFKTACLEAGLKVRRLQETPHFFQSGGSTDQGSAR